MSDTQHVSADEVFLSSLSELSATYKIKCWICRLFLLLLLLFFNTFTFLILNSWITKLLSPPRPWTGINTLLPGVDCPGFKDRRRLPPLVLVVALTAAVGPHTETAEKCMTSAPNTEQQRGATRIPPGKTESQAALHFGTNGKRTGL